MNKFRGITALKKIWRFLIIYGLGKTLFKVFGRLRLKYFFVKSHATADIGVIGCGQFAYATIGYCIWRRYRNRFVCCFDINKNNQRSFSKFFGLQDNLSNAYEVIHHHRVKVVYIASNHASHTDYAIEALQAGRVVYVEKPVSVTHEQLMRLLNTVRKTNGLIFAGYNRPFSKAIRRLRTEIEESNSPLTLSCFISGHLIEADHWYRNPEEGTRICGNVGHWLDLAIHILSWNELPDHWCITLAYSNQQARDDDIAITLTSKRGDLVNIVLTARSEPFEGINETINFQQNDVIAKIDDFRRITVWKREQLKKFRFWPKDVGHNLAIIQPFSKVHRNWREVERSTLLMLFIKDMVVAGEQFAEFSFSEEWKKLGVES